MATNGNRNCPSGGSHSGSGSQTEDDKQMRKEESREAVRILQEMSATLNTGLDNEGLGLCIRLCELGASPTDLANLIKGWRMEKSQEQRND